VNIGRRRSRRAERPAGQPRKTPTRVLGEGVKMAGGRWTAAKGRKRLAGTSTTLGPYPVAGLLGSECGGFTFPQKVSVLGQVVPIYEDMEQDFKNRSQQNRKQRLQKSPPKPPHRPRDDTGVEPPEGISAAALVVKGVNDENLPEDIAWELKLRSRRNRKQRLSRSRPSPPPEPAPSPTRRKDGTGREPLEAA
jgi:hypothetical protein